MHQLEPFRDFSLSFSRQLIVAVEGVEVVGFGVGVVKQVLLDVFKDL